MSFITQATKKKRSIFGKCIQNDNNYISEDFDDFKYDVKQDLEIIQQTPETEQQQPDQHFINEVHKVKPTQPGRPLLVLDLDETLVHSSFQQVDNADFSLSIQVQDPTPQIFKVYVYIRPYLQEFLQKMSQYYDLCVFTASLAVYCDSVMDKIDPQRLVKYRLYRNHCSCVRNLYIKDLSLLNYPQNKILIIDNSQISFAYHPENGILCPEFYDDKKDKWLKDAIDPLIKASQYDDVRKITKNFK